MESSAMDLEVNRNWIIHSVHQLVEKCRDCIGEKNGFPVSGWEIENEQNTKNEQNKEKKFLEVAKRKLISLLSPTNLCLD